MMLKTDTQQTVEHFARKLACVPHVGDLEAGNQPRLAFAQQPRDSFCAGRVSAEHAMRTQ